MWVSALLTRECLLQALTQLQLAVDQTESTIVSEAAARRSRRVERTKMRGTCLLFLYQLWLMPTKGGIGGAGMRLVFRALPGKALTVQLSAVRVGFKAKTSLSPCEGSVSFDRPDDKRSTCVHVQGVC